MQHEKKKHDVYCIHHVSSCIQHPHPVEFYIQLGEDAVYKCLQVVHTIIKARLYECAAYLMHSVKVNCNNRGIYIPFFYPCYMSASMLQQKCK